MDLEPQELMTPGWAEDSDEDSVEAEMHEETQLQSSQAAKARTATARITEPTVRLAEPAHDSLLYRRMARVDVICNVVFAAAAVLGIVIAGAWHAANLHARASASQPAPAVAAAPTLAVPTAPAPAQQPYIHVRNPFDASEAFVFPAETSETQARQAMAELLLQRARDRLAQGLVLRHEGIGDRTRADVQEQPKIFVSKLDGSPSQL